MSPPRVHADFHNADNQGRVRLNCVGTIHDLAGKGIVLEDGLRLMLSDDEGHDVEGEVQFAEDEKLWVAVIDWSLIRARGV